MGRQYFDAECMKFLQAVAENNNRDWFGEHKQWYEDAVRSPALAFIKDMSDDLATISPYFIASPKKVGGSLMRIFRDVRYARDKRPYKTNIGIQFRHQRGKDIHAPGFYLHIEPGDCFIGVGIWRPGSQALAQIRDSLCEHSDEWLSIIKAKKFSQYFSLGGEALVNGPRGYSREHPLIEDLKRKDFIALSKIDDEDVFNTSFKSMLLKRYQAGSRYMQFLCQSLALQY